MFCIMAFNLNLMRYDGSCTDLFYCTCPVTVLIQHIFTYTVH